MLLHLEIIACRHLVTHPDATWHDVPDLPKAACALLDKDFVRSTSVVEKAQTSSDGSTCKLLVRLQDGMQVEAVVMTYEKDGASCSCALYAYCIVKFTSIAVDLLACNSSALHSQVSLTLVLAGSCMLMHCALL